MALWQVDNSITQLGHVGEGDVDRVLEPLSHVASLGTASMQCKFGAPSLLTTLSCTLCCLGSCVSPACWRRTALKVIIAAAPASSSSIVIIATAIVAITVAAVNVAASSSPPPPLSP